MNNCKNILKLEEDCYKKLFEWNTKIRSKKATDTLDINDMTQLECDLNLAFTFMNNTLNKK